MPSPRVVTTAAVVSVTLRLSLGTWSFADLLVLGVVIVFTGPVEWVIHLRILHSDPDSFQARKFAAGVSHRKHHLDPPELEYLLLSGSDAAVFTVMLAISSVAWALPLLWITGLDVFPAVLTAVAAAHLGLANYEWTHLLVHTRYRPKTPFGARLTRNHRLHHFRNEDYWLGVTSNLGDRILGTLPKTKTDVALSDTARTLGQD